MGMFRSLKSMYKPQKGKFPGEKEVFNSEIPIA